MWTGERCGRGRKLPRHCHPLQFLLAPLRDTSKNCKEAIFALGNGISRRKNQHPRPTYTPSGAILLREGCGSLALSRELVDGMVSHTGGFMREGFCLLALSRGWAECELSSILDRQSARGFLPSRAFLDFSAGGTAEAVRCRFFIFNGSRFRRRRGTARCAGRCRRRAPARSPAQGPAARAPSARCRRSHRPSPIPPAQPWPAP